MPFYVFFLNKSAKGCSNIYARMPSLISRYKYDRETSKENMHTAYEVIRCIAT